MRNAALLQAIEKAGSASALARALNISPAAVNQWRQVPVDRCLAVHDLTGIPLHDLRPDVYRPEVKRRAAASQAAA